MNPCLIRQKSFLSLVVIYPMESHNTNSFYICWNEHYNKSITIKTFSEQEN